jgi:hypothetical protein
MHATDLVTFILGICAGFGLMWALDLRRQLKAAQKALEAKATCCFDCGRKDGTHTELCRFTRPSIREVQARIDEYDPPLPKPVPDFTGGIGPTAIGNREMFEHAQEEENKEPRFASPRTLNPDLGDITDAAREATNGRAN